MKRIGQQPLDNQKMSGSSVEEQHLSPQIQIPQFLTHALQDENSLREMILSPESLLNNLLDGIEEAPIQDEQDSEDDILKDSDEKLKNVLNNQNTIQIVELKSRSHLEGHEGRSVKMTTTNDRRATVLLHKRPYDFRRFDLGQSQDQHFQNEASVYSEETAYFQNQMVRREMLNFDFEQNIMTESMQGFHISQKFITKMGKQDKDHIQFKLQFQNKSSGEADHLRNLRSLRGQRLDSTKSCTAEIGYNLFGDLDKTTTSRIPEYYQSRPFNQMGTEVSQTQLQKCQSISNDLYSQPCQDKTKDNSNRPFDNKNDVSMISNDSCFKVPRSIVKSGRILPHNQYNKKPQDYGVYTNNPRNTQKVAQGLSGKYVGMIINKQQQMKKHNQMGSPSLKNSNSKHIQDRQNQKTPQFRQNDQISQMSYSDTYSNSQSSMYSSQRPEKKWIRGPYKTKRQLKLDGKMVESSNAQISLSKRHQSTIQKAAIAKQILHKIESNNSQSLQHIAQDKDSQLSILKGQSEKSQNPDLHILNEPDENCKPCNCSSSGCLKLYCECFKNNRYCGGQCRCSCCHNSVQHESKRLLAKEQILMRNPFAFRSKFGQITKESHDADLLTQGKIVLKELEIEGNIQNGQNGSVTDQSENKKRHFKGCNCRKSGCRKKYCECFQQGVLCSEFCKCDGCQNCQEKPSKDDHCGSQNSGGKCGLEKEKSCVDQTIESLLCNDVSPPVGLKQGTKNMSSSSNKLISSDLNLKSSLTGLTLDSTEGQAKKTDLFNQMRQTDDFPQNTSNFLAQSKSCEGVHEKNDCKIFEKINKLITEVPSEPLQIFKTIQ